jgi:hypothetical protein
MLWGERRSSMNEADRQEYRRLTDTESPSFILDAPGYYAAITYPIFDGDVASCEA